MNDQELPAHTHVVSASSLTASLDDPTNAYWAGLTNGSIYASGDPNTTMNVGMISSVGGGQAHLNMQPFLVLNFIIALQGIFPSQN